MAQKIRQDINIGSNIRALRRKSHLTQAQVVAKLNEYGIASSRSIYSQIECGVYNIRMSEIVVLLEIFNVDYNELFAGVKVQPKQGEDVGQEKG